MNYLVDVPRESGRTLRSVRGTNQHSVLLFVALRQTRTHTRARFAVGAIALWYIYQIPLNTRVCVICLSTTHTHTYTRMHISSPSFSLHSRKVEDKAFLFPTRYIRGCPLPSLPLFYSCSFSCSFNSTQPPFPSRSPRNEEQLSCAALKSGRKSLRAPSGITH